MLFAGYKTGQELVKYINSADLFIHVSRAEAGPVVCMEAMACGISIFCTDSAGKVVGINNYKDWERELINYLDGKSIKTLDLNIVKEHYEWKNIAKKFAAIYDNVRR